MTYRWGGTRKRSYLHGEGVIESNKGGGVQLWGTAYSIGTKVYPLIPEFLFPNKKGWPGAAQHFVGGALKGGW